jgi:hypothetical protein
MKFSVFFMMLSSHFNCLGHERLPIFGTPFPNLPDLRTPIIDYSARPGATQFFIVACDWVQIQA